MDHTHPKKWVGWAELAVFLYQKQVENGNSVTTKKTLSQFQRCGPLYKYRTAVWTAIQIPNSGVNRYTNTEQRCEPLYKYLKCGVGTRVG